MSYTYETMGMKRVGIFTLILLLQLISVNLILAQEQTDEKSDFSIDVGLVNRFIWRGIFLDDKPNIQPHLFYSNNGFTAGAWGSYNLTTGYAQTNFYLNYSKNDLTIQAMDHYIGHDTVDIDYFDYRRGATNHWMEASIAYRIQNFNVLASTFFYGGDRDANNDNRYSSYAELGYTAEAKDVTFNFFIGASLNESVYADGFAIVNTGIKASNTLKINDNYSIPVSFTIASNPDKQKMHFIIECFVF